MSDLCKIVKVVYINKNKENLFFIHDGSGHIDSLLNFFYYLKKFNSYNIYAIKSNLTRRYYPSRVEREELVDCYKTKLKEIQSSGIYYIIGKCIGGMIGYDLAENLYRDGNQIGSLSVLCTPKCMHYNLSRLFQMNGFSVKREIKLIKRGIPCIYNEIKDIEDIENLWDYIGNYLEQNDVGVFLLGKLISKQSLIHIPNFKLLPNNEILKRYNTLRSFRDFRKNYKWEISNDFKINSFIPHINKSMFVKVDEKIENSKNIYIDGVYPDVFTGNCVKTFVDQFIINIKQ